TGAQQRREGALASLEGAACLLRRSGLLRLRARMIGHARRHRIRSLAREHHSREPPLERTRAVRSGGRSRCAARRVRTRPLPVRLERQVGRRGRRRGGRGIRNRRRDRKSTRLNSSHVKISYAVFCLKKKKGRKNG